MTFSIEKRRRRRKRSDLAAVFYLGFLLILSQVCSPSCAEKMTGGGGGGSRWSPARKARVFGSGHPGVLPVSVSSSASSPESTASNDGNRIKVSSSTDEINYEEEKRLVHTGPNPLHN